ncbi:MAG TPA: sigma-70 family RNA polymerase sigma factor [Roseiflexaceae bacterium]|nr:sigma-70 family RNA polymerase sigma factor [Roseiflexaceae bacterium]
MRIINYHNDHHVVEALSDPQHPEYATTWRTWTSQVVPALVSSKLGPRATLPQDALNDMVQEALIDLFRGLAQFNYRSRFSTWVYTVVSHSSTRFGRALGARKRTPQREAASLEQQLEAGTCAQEVADRLDEQVEDRLLRELVLDVLTRENDPRLSRIFQLWFDEGNTQRMIGARLHLSVTRIHTLVDHIRELLRNDPQLLDWLGRGSLEQGQQRTL